MPCSVSIWTSLRPTGLYITSESAESGCGVTFTDFQARPLIMARIVSQSGLAKDLLVRVWYHSSNNGNTTVIVGAEQQHALAMTFDGSGNCTSVAVCASHWSLN